jgi:ParB-like chromosome segregation protein Spo0J
MMCELIIAKMEDIHVNSVALRSVDKKSEAFLSLRDLIRAHGLSETTLLCVKVRKSTIGADIKYYVLIDGLCRYSAALDAGLTEIPAILVNLPDVKIKEVPVGVHRIENTLFTSAERDF